MKPIEIPPLPERQSSLQSPPQVLVEMILAQQKMIEQLAEEVERLKNRTCSNSQTSSKPPSSDLLQCSEKPPDRPASNDESEPRHKPRGQPGHVGKTRRGFSRIDRYEVLRPQSCRHCGGQQFMNAPARVNLHQMAQLVERPIEVVEYQQYTCRCEGCGGLEQGQLPETIVVGQSLGVSL